MNRDDVEPPRRRQPSAFRELTLMRIRSFLREPEALFWTFVFPILMAIGLGLAFRGESAELVPIAVVRGSRAEMFLPALRAHPEIDATTLDSRAAARALRKGDVSLVITGRDTLVYRYDATRTETRLARLLVDDVIQGAAGRSRLVTVREDRVRRAGARYIDWVIPGLIGLNLMSTGMWGIGFSLVTMRQKKQLKRLASTPMRRRDFLGSQIVARSAFLLLEIPPIIAFAWIAFGVRVRGSLPVLGAVVLLGALCFAGLGLLCASRARTIEGVSGLLNLVMLPMFILSGVFFPASRFPDIVQPVVQALPLTALNDALRTVYNEGLGLTAAGGELAILLAWTAVAFALSLRIFRWQ